MLKFQMDNHVQNYNKIHNQHDHDISVSSIELSVGTTIGDGTCDRDNNNNKTLTDHKAQIVYEYWLTQGGECIECIDYFFLMRGRLFLIPCLSYCFVKRKFQNETSFCIYHPFQASLQAIVGLLALFVFFIFFHAQYAPLNELTSIAMEILAGILLIIVCRRILNAANVCNRKDKLHSPIELGRIYAAADISSAGKELEIKDTVYDKVDLIPYLFHVSQTKSNHMLLQYGLLLCLFLWFGALLMNRETEYSIDDHCIGVNSVEHWLIYPEVNDMACSSKKLIDITSPDRIGYDQPDIDHSNDETVYIEYIGTNNLGNKGKIRVETASYEGETTLHVIVNCYGSLLWSPVVLTANIKVDIAAGVTHFCNSEFEFPNVESADNDEISFTKLLALIVIVAAIIYFIGEYFWFKTEVRRLIKFFEQPDQSGIIFKRTISKEVLERMLPLVLKGKLCDLNTSIQIV